MSYPEESLNPAPVVLAITPGCPAGIGPELLQKAEAALSSQSSVKLIVCGKKNYAAQPGRPTSSDLDYQREALLEAISLVKAKKADAIVTGPIRKAALVYNGIQFQGQTELLHHFLAADNGPPLMCFTGGDFVLGLNTVHLPLKEASKALTEEGLRGHIHRLFAEFSSSDLSCQRRLASSVLRKDASLRWHDKPEEPGDKSRELGIKKLAVLGLNPHAGEEGLLGDEELKIISPVIKSFQAQGFPVAGPLSPDGFFGNLKRMSKEHYPFAVLAMYHDQGLIPYKLIYNAIVNVTLGLKVPRTSPAGGTADDIAGKNLADPASMIAAIQQAAEMVRKRQ